MMTSWRLGKLDRVLTEDRAEMKNLVGRNFQIADGRYRIVDVQRLGSDAMVYAERVETASVGMDAGGRHSPARTAFHYGDIAPFLEAGQSA